jgi:hypothetical protein
MYSLGVGCQDQTTILYAWNNNDSVKSTQEFKVDSQSVNMLERKTELISFLYSHYTIL